MYRAALMWLDDDLLLGSVEVHGSRLHIVRACISCWLLECPFCGFDLGLYDIVLGISLAACWRVFSPDPCAWLVLLLRWFQPA
jgi:hypothetical protein